MKTIRHRLAIAAVGLVLTASAVAACEPGDGGGGTTTTAPAVTCATPGLPTTVAYRTIPRVAPNLTSLDIHAPATVCDAPVVMWVHGGGYQNGDKANQIAAKRTLFNARGWILVSVNYRLTAPGSPTSAQFPDHYDDVAAAIAWVKDSIGAYGGDPTRLALLGHSAGADIVSNVAAKPDYLEAYDLGLDAIDCLAPLDTEGFDKVSSVGSGDSLQWELALGNNPDYLTDTSATLLLADATGVPDTLTVYRGTAQRQQIQWAYLLAVADTGATVAMIDGRGLSHNDVNTRIGAAGDEVMTPPLLRFLTTCLA